MNNQGRVREIHQLPHHVLAAALPDLRPMNSGYEIRTEFARWTLRQRQTFTSWEQAWNTWTHASPHAPGTVELSVLCPDCHGRLFSTRRGIPSACTTCRGRRRTTVRSRAVWQNDTPADDDELADVVDGLGYECPDCGERHDGATTGTERCPSCEEDLVR